ncbi:putative inactive receptor kinase [Senna tora]|uniref:Putative inactive receptor kinase n=1 Tax=Senna tora TaxID=362788 RepID=A0A834XL41_9FABA|nr:putative inactive receptor kinase [Senna tora]
MMLQSYFVTIPTFLLLLLFFPTSGDLNSEKQALLDLAAAVRHGQKINWNSATSICNSWVGITCSPNGSHVIAVRLPGVGLRGSLPSNTLSKLSGLMILSLRSNSLNGNLPNDILSHPSLRFIYLQYNNFSGDIPGSLSHQLNFLDLSYNSFTGKIPVLIQNLTNLTGLNLQNNSLMGPIPDLNLPKLKTLNLSYNNLNGSIPSALQKFPASSFHGNLMLCEPHLHQCSSVSPSPALSPSTDSSKPSDLSNKKLSTGAIVAIAFIGFALFVPLLIVVLCYLKKINGEQNAAPKQKDEKLKEEFGSGVQEPEKNKLISFERCSYSFDLDDLLRASAEVLGKGSCGTTYKAILEEGNTVVVKRLKEVVVGKKEFEQQMETVQKLGHHPNVIPIRAYYYSKDEKLLVYDYIAAGSLSRLLHGTKGAGRIPLDWESRLKISLGAARGIAHIHSTSGRKFVHGNIKSSNVLLRLDFEGCISDFGLTPLISFSVPSRSPGYQAPEVVQTRKSSQKSDVYSFGVVLLEMLTGKTPVQYSGHDDVVDLPKWVQSVVREEWTAEVFDLELMRYPNIEEEMVQMLQLALACVTKVPDMRPSMVEVVRIIEEIRASNSENPPLTYLATNDISRNGAPIRGASVIGTSSLSTFWAACNSNSGICTSLSSKGICTISPESSDAKEELEINPVTFLASIASLLSLTEIGGSSKRINSWTDIGLISKDSGVGRATLSGLANSVDSSVPVVPESLTSLC